MQSDILVKDQSAFGQAHREMGTILGQFTTDMQKVAQDSASPAAAGKMPEGINFMKQEREGRELLVQYMTKTSDGLAGYENATAALGHEHLGLVALNTTRLKTILQPSEGVIPNSSMFNWRDAVAHQIENQIGGR
jgi:hypothetical protein